MRALPLILAATGIGVAVYILKNSPSPQYANRADPFEHAASKAGAWGAKQRLAGAGRGLVGTLKEGAGKITRDDDLQAAGLVDQASGAVKDAAGRVAGAVGQTIHDLNEV